MTERQKELRAERVAIMVVEGMEEEYAQEFCDRLPSLYGTRERTETQETLL